jgi:hypothetical protein
MVWSTLQIPNGIKILATNESARSSCRCELVRRIKGCTTTSTSKEDVVNSITNQHEVTSIAATPTPSTTTTSSRVLDSGWFVYAKE